MSKLVWDQIGERVYEAGVEKGVVYPQVEGEYPAGAAWNGLISVTESPSGAEAEPLYANDSKYAELTSNEEFGGSIEAYTYPEEFAECNGLAELAKGVKLSQQKRIPFGLSYINKIGNDATGLDYGYKLHLVYGAKAAPSEKANNTINDSPEAVTMSWEFTTTPVSVSDFKPTAHIEIDSTKVDKEKLKKLEDILYGTADEEARLPLPDEVATLMNAEG